MNADLHPSSRTQAFAILSASRQPTPVYFWSCVGAVFLGLELWFTARWIMSDQFVSVPSGPDLPPGWMRAALDIGQVVMPTVWLCSFCWFVVRPAFRERRMTTDGLILIGCTLASLWDSLSDVGQYWFTYNSYLINRGSILGVLPITLSPHAAGANEGWPLLFINTLYGNFIVVAVLMCALLRFVQSKWPRFGTFRLVILCFALGVIADIVVEGVILLPLGFWTYAGGHWSINSQTYYKFPLHEAVCAGSVFACLTCLRFFVDDKGQTFAERGIEKISASPLKKSFMRATAITGATTLIFIVMYHLPQGFLALYSVEWPDDVKNRSYFTNRICGAQVNLACPGPHTPIARPGAPRLDFSHHFSQ